MEEILKDFSVEKYIIAAEIKEQNKNQLRVIREQLPHAEEEFVSHEDFKKSLADVKWIIRTGEATPYSNIILQSKNIF